MKEIFVCLSCRRVFEDYGDDHWLECPYCHATKFTKAIKGVDYILKKKRT